MSSSPPGLIDRVLPGATRVLAGRPLGLWILGSWVTLVGIAVWRLPRIGPLASSGGPGNWLALAALVD